MKVDHAKQLGAPDHKSLVLWAADCAEHVLTYFEKKHPQDDRPRKAIQAGRAWVRGESTVRAARSAAFAAHAAARDADHPAAQAAARAAGHAAATAHVAGHARHAARYAVAAVTAAGNDAATERVWQNRHLPEPLRLVAFPVRDDKGVLMKTDQSTPATMDEYISGFPQDVQEKLQKIRLTIRKAAPDAEETIKYQMPTFMLNGNLVYFAAFKKHIGFYGAPTGSGTFKDELSVYAGPKGSLKFPLDQPIPFDLISKIVKFRVKENLERADAKQKTK